MKFGPVSVEQALGAIVAHTVRAGDLTVRKGRTLTSADIGALVEAGIAAIVVARLEVGDLHENLAAKRVASALEGPGLRAERAATGRANLIAQTSGLFVADRRAVDAMNEIDSAITLATLSSPSRVKAGQMVATVKIIPFSAPERAVDAAVSGALGDAPVLRVESFKRRRIGLAATCLPSLKESVMDKTRRVFDARLAETGAAIVCEDRCPHETEALAGSLRQLVTDCDVIVIFGASAIVDPDDVVPAAIVAAGGVVDHVGMPVDPGNLLLTGHIGDIPVIGAPGCARSPKENGFDWILYRVLAGEPVSPATIRAMGVGGLLGEIVTRPQPRRDSEQSEDPMRLAAIVLAAGRSSRMGAVNKLTLPVGGKPMVRHAVEAARAANLETVVVTGHEADRIEEMLDGVTASIVFNSAFETGLSSSLKAGIVALPGTVDAAFVLLGDMPFVSAGLLLSMKAALDPASGHWITVPIASGGRWGNPVLIHRRYFPQLMQLDGDRGARRFLESNSDAIAFVDARADEALADIDTQESYGQLEQF